MLQVAAIVCEVLQWIRAMVPEDSEATVAAVLYDYEVVLGHG